MQDIRIRTATALKAMGDLHKTWKDKGVSIHTKVRLYRALIQPIALYGCETWTLKQAEESKLHTFEMSALRKILGVSKLDKIRNVDIRTRTGCTRSIVQIVYERQHKWLGHVLRMDSERIAPTVLQGRVDGKRRQGKPRETWFSEVTKRYGGADEMPLKKAIRLAQDRSRWREFEHIVGAHVRPTRLRAQ